MLKASLAALVLFTSPAAAEICDYKPSRLKGMAVAGLSGVGISGAGAGMQAAGYYTLVHASSGLTMLGSTAAGASGAGTVGIIGGTAGAIGSAAAAIMSPAVVIGGAVLGVAASGYEGICYFQVERVEDYDKVLNLLKGLSEHADQDYFRLEKGEGEKSAVLHIRLDPEEEELTAFEVRDLYIADGELKHRERFLDPVIGELAFIEASGKEDSAE